jgi:hypothetical protein
MMILKLGSGAIAPAVLVAGLLLSPAFADTHDFFGNWVNSDQSSNDITRIVVLPAGPGNVAVRVFARCYPTDCDWGTLPGHSYVDTFTQHDVRIVTASFDPGFAHTLVILKASPGGDLRVQALTEFTDNSGRTDYEYRGQFHRVAFFPPPIPLPVPPPIPLPFQPKWPPVMPQPLPLPLPLPLVPLTGPEDCIGFNPATVTVAHVGGSWKVMSGAMSMLDFGPDKFSADRAASVIIGENFNQQCFVARPNAPMMYWKAGNHVPSSQIPGQDCVGNNPATTTVVNTGGSWTVTDGPHALLNYGDQASANQARAIIKKYHLNRQCFIQRPNAQMSYWLAE